jgi:hypothetical protein
VRAKYFGGLCHLASQLGVLGYNPAKGFDMKDINNQIAIYTAENGQTLIDGAQPYSH